MLGPAAFSATACAGPMHCFAFGLAGTFATSDNGGQTWAVSQLAGMASLTVLSATCPSTDRCVALAKPESPSSAPAGQQSLPGVALYSNDGGRSWSTAAVSGSAVEFLGALSCPGSTVCYAIAAGLAQESSDFLLESVDGGSTWPTRLTAPSGGFRDALACPAVDRCVATGGSFGIVATSDGGLHWTEEREPLGAGGMPGIGALACSSLSTCTGVGSEPSPGYPMIITTTNAGRTWRIAHYPNAEGAGGGYDAVSCSGLRCAAVAGTFPEVGLLSASNDGGKTWRDVTLGDGGAFSAVSCASADGCIAAGSIGNGSAVLALGVGGQRWSRRYLGPGTDWTALSCASRRHCVAAGENAPFSVVAAVATSDDGGAHLKVGHLPAGLSGIVAIDCPTGRHCVAVADATAPPKLQQEGNLTVAAMLSSDDGGRHWRRDALDVPADSFDSISCPTASVCYAVGATPEAAGVSPQDAIVKTTDGGARWVAEQDPAFPPQPPAGASGSEIPGSGLTSVTCFSATSCVSGGPAGVLTTSDGSRWSVDAETPTSGPGGVVVGGALVNQLQLLACPTVSHCIGVLTGSGAEVLAVTNDGGRIWRPAASPATFSANALVCPAASECLAAGSDAHGAVVLESFDGGRQWSAAPLPTLGTAPVASLAPSGYTAISCPDPAYCVALGAGTVGEVAIAR